MTIIILPHLLPNSGHCDLWND